MANPLLDIARRLRDENTSSKTSNPLLDIARKLRDENTSSNPDDPSFWTPSAPADDPGFDRFVDENIEAVQRSNRFKNEENRARKIAFWNGVRSIPGMNERYDDSEAYTAPAPETNVPTSSLLPSSLPVEDDSEQPTVVTPEELAFRQHQISRAKMEYGLEDIVSGAAFGRGKEAVQSRPDPRNTTWRDDVANGWNEMLGKDVVEDLKRVSTTLSPQAAEQQVRDDAHKAAFWEYMDQQLDGYNPNVEPSPDDIASMARALAPVSGQTVKFNGEEFSAEEFGALSKEYVEEARHLDRFQHDAQYRNEWLLRHTGLTEDRYRNKVADELESRIDEIDKLFPSPGSSTMAVRGSYASLGRAMNERPSSETPAVREWVKKARRAVKSLRKNNFGSGFQEGWDFSDVATLGFKGLGDKINLTRALNAASDGRKLSKGEQALVDAWAVQQEAEAAISMLGGRSIGNAIGSSSAESIGFMGGMLATGGVANSATRGITKAITRTAAREAAEQAVRKGASSAIVKGIQKGSLHLGKSIVGSAARTPMTGHLYSNYTDKRLEQFSPEERRDNDEVSLAIRKMPKSAWKDALSAYLETFMEYQSEDVGQWIGAGANALSGRIARSRLGAMVGLKNLPGAKRNAAVEWFKDRAKITNFAGEVLSEAYGDAMVNLFEGNRQGWRQMMSQDYWWTLCGVSALLSGSTGALNVPSQIKSSRTASRLSRLEREALAAIENPELKDRIAQIASIESITDRSRELSKLDWGSPEISTRDAVHVLDFINARTKLDAMQGNRAESRRLLRILPDLEFYSEMQYKGADGKSPSGEIMEAADQNGNTYYVLSGDPEKGGEVSVYDHTQQIFRQMPSSQLAQWRKTDLSDYIAVNHALKFGVEMQQEKLDNLAMRIDEAVDAGISDKTIANIIQSEGLKVFEPADQATLVTGEKVVVDSFSKGAYEVVFEDGGRGTVGFNEVLQPDARIAEAQRAETGNEGQADADVEPNVGDMAEEMAREAVVNIRNADDDVVYTVDVAGADEPVNILRGASLVYDSETGAVDVAATLRNAQEKGLPETVAIRYADGTAGMVHISELQTVLEAASSEEIVQGARAVAEQQTEAEQQQVLDESGQNVTGNAPDTDNVETIGEAGQQGDDPLLGRSLTSSEAARVVEQMEAAAVPAPEVELTPGNWVAQFGEDGKVQTPIGEVKMGENQYLKLAQKGRNGKLGMIRPTLADPYLIIEDRSRAKEGQATERPSTYVFVKPFVDQSGERSSLFTSITVQRDGQEVVISNQEKDAGRIGRLLKEGRLIYIKEATLPSESVPSEQGDQSTVPHEVTPSVNKDTKTIPENQITEPEIPRLKNGQPDYNAMPAEMLAVEMSAALGHDKAVERIQSARNVNARNANKLEKSLASMGDLNKAMAAEQRLASMRREDQRLAGALELLGVTEEPVDVKKPAENFSREIDRLFPDGLPNVRARVLADIARGQRFVWSDTADGVKRGVATELGFSGNESERRARFGTLGSEANGAKHVSSYVHDLWEDSNGYAFDMDDAALRDEVIDVLLTTPSRASAMEQLREMAARTEEDPSAPRDAEDLSAAEAYDRERNESQADWGVAEQPGPDDVPFSVSGDTVHAPERITPERWNAIIDQLNLAVGAGNVVTDPDAVRAAYDAILARGAKIRRQQVESANERFNEQLEQLEEGTLPSGDKITLGNPSAVLLACGVNNAEITATQRMLKGHIAKHGLSLDDLRNLPMALESPIMVYEWGDKARSTIVITEIPRGNERIAVAIRLKPGRNGIAVNAVASVHGKSVERLLADMNTPLTDFGVENLKWVDKEKVLDWIAAGGSFGPSGINQGLVVATNIVENFENPKIEEENVTSSGADAMFFRTPQGEVYGFTTGGVIYLDSSRMNADTPMHEYTELWAQIVARENPSWWNRAKEIMRRDTGRLGEIWRAVNEDPNYRGLPEDLRASETLSRATGEWFSRQQAGIKDDAGLFAALKRIVREFWRKLKSVFKKWSDKELAAMTADDVMGAPVKDFVEGIDLQKYRDERTLAGVHNISAEKFKKAVKKGGFANPSAAVIDVERQSHEGYGEISLILPSSLVDSSSGRNAGTWAADAWTPTYPAVERRFGDAGSAQFVRDLEALPEPMRNETRMGMNDWLDGRDAHRMAYMFLHERGEAPQLNVIPERYGAETRNAIIQATQGGFSLFDTSAEDRKIILDAYIREEFGGDRSAYERNLDERVKRLEGLLDHERTLVRRRAKEDLEGIREYGFDYKALSDFVRKVGDDAHRSGKVDAAVTKDESVKYIKEHGLQAEFDKWVDSLEERYGVEEVLFNGFTPSGTRRYVPNTLENASKMMTRDGRNGATGMGISFNNFAAGLLKSSGSLAEIRKRKDSLTPNHEEVEAFRDKWSEVFYDLGEKCQPDASGYDDYGLYRLAEAAQKRDPQAYLQKEYGVELSDEDAARLKEMVHAIRNEMPAMYFETKFERPVYLNEFAGAVVPENTDPEILNALDEAGVPYRTYGPAEDRPQVIREFTRELGDVRFMSDAEEIHIENAARANGTYMKAPNGMPTNLTERQWVQVRTRAFKEWFGDWEKAARIEKLRNSASVEITGNEIEASEDVKEYRRNAMEYGKKLRGEYINKDTGKNIVINRDSLAEVLHHDGSNIAHIQSIAAIPMMIENAIYIETSPVSDAGNRLRNATNIHYYVCGLNIGNEPYTAKLVIAELSNGERYYDHKLTQIEKGELLNRAELSSTVADSNSPLSDLKDKRLLSLLQTNASKVVDENGEPLVVYHGTPLSRSQITPNRGWHGDEYIRQEAPFHTFRGGEYSGLIFTSVDYDKAQSIAEKRAESIPDDEQGNEQWTSEGYVYDLYVNARRLFDPKDPVAAYTVLRSMGSEIPTLSFYGGKGNNVTIEEALSIATSERNSWLITETPEFIARIKELGYDGLAGYDEGVRYIAAMSPNQLKDARHNSGDFSARNDDIRFQVVGNTTQGGPRPTRQQQLLSDIEDAVGDPRNDLATTIRNFTPQVWEFWEALADELGEPQARELLSSFENAGERSAAMESLRGMRQALLDRENRLKEAEIQRRADRREYHEKVMNLYSRLADEDLTPESLPHSISDYIRALITPEMMDVMGIRDFRSIVSDVEEALRQSDIQQTLAEYRKRRNRYHRSVQSKKESGQLEKERLQVEASLQGFTSAVLKTRPMQRIMDAAADLDFKLVRNRFDRLLKLKVEGLNASGVNVGKSVDDRTRRFFKLFRDGLSLTEEQLGAQMEDPSEASDAVVLHRMYRACVEEEQDLDDLNARLRKYSRESVRLYRVITSESKAISDSMRDEARDKRRTVRRAIDSARAAIVAAKSHLASSYSELNENLTLKIQTGRTLFKEQTEARERYRRQLVSEAIRAVEPKGEKKNGDFPEGNKLIKAVTSPFNTFENMIQTISINDPGRDGIIYRRLMLGRDGWAESNARYQQGKTEAIQGVVAAFQSLVSDHHVRNTDDLFRYFQQPLKDASGNQLILETISPEGSFYKSRSVVVTRGKALLWIAYGRQDDLMPRLDNIGITREKLESLIEVLSPADMDFLNWLQRELLPELRRERYNPVYRRMFGVDMDSNPWYFPFVANKNMVYRNVDMSQIEADGLPATITGSVIRRKRTMIEPDLDVDIMSVLMNHLDEMEHWSAFAPLVSDLNALLSSSQFRNALDSQEKGRSNDFKKVCFIAVGAYKKFQPDPSEQFMTRIEKTCAGAKIAYRGFTAIKQLLSGVMFRSYTSDIRFQGILTRHLLLGGRTTWNWALENIPSFRERWESRYAGDERLALKAPARGKAGQWFFDHRLLHETGKGIKREGMYMNALIDAWTCAKGARAVYEFEKIRLLDRGFDATEADRQAKLLAAIAMNTTQQSSEGAYLSALQSDRTIGAAAISTFNNSSFAFGRIVQQGWRVLSMSKQQQDVILSAKRQYWIDHGKSETEAAQFAQDEMKRLRRDARLKIIIAGYLGNLIWNLFPPVVTATIAGFYIKDRDGEDTSYWRAWWNILQNELSWSAFVTPAFRNFVGGATAESFMNGYGLNFTLFISDAEKLTKEIKEAAQEFNPTLCLHLLGKLGAWGISTDLSSFVNIYKGAEKLLTKDDERIAGVFQMLNSPKAIMAAAELYPASGETEEEYVGRMAYINTITDGEMKRIDSTPGYRLEDEDLRTRRNLKKWARNYETYRRAAALNMRWERNRSGVVEIPELKKVDEDYDAALKWMGLTSSGTPSDEIKQIYGSISDEEKARIREIVPLARQISFAEKMTATNVVFDETWKEQVRALVESKKKVIEIVENYKKQ